jgi:arylsulfatase A-like enzyme
MVPPSLLHAPTGTSHAMNFIVIVSDTFRYDYLGANGNTWIKMPELDAFSKMA